MLGNRENVAVVQNNVERKFRNSILCTTPQSLAGVHCSSACSNGANIGERKTRTQSEFCTWQNSVRGKSPKMCTQCTSPWDGQTSAKFGWPPSVQWRSEDAKPVEFVGGVNRSQTLVGRSSPYSEDTFRRYCCSTSFFSDCLYMPQLRTHSPTKLCDGAQMANFCVLYFSEPRAALSNTASTWQRYCTVL